MVKARRVAVVGLGLVGGSLARALSAAGHTVIGVDGPETARAARRAGAVDSVAPLAQAAAEADVVVLAASPRVNLRLLRQPVLRGVLVTDVTSVKAPMVREAARRGLRFVGGHPMAGGTGRGFAASRADLFVGRPWILTPLTASAPADLRLLRSLIRSAGAGRIAVMAPEEHDRAMAYLSHLPQLVSWALADAASHDPVAGQALALAGAGYRDMTRLAASPLALWREIARDNASELSQAVAAFDRALRRTRRRLGLR